MPREDLLARPNRPAIPAGALTGEKACAVVAALQPEGAVVVDESITNSIWYYPITSGLPPFTLLTLTGGSLGQGPACAAGAAVACPDRPVINLQADGAAMYTVQALWTQAREGLNVTTLVFANRRYDILRFELARFGVASPGPAADRLTDLSGIDWVGLGASMGVDSCAVHTTVDLVSALERSLAESGPHLIRIDL
jgi:acetolactate synthase-1/2/3 large subunit